MSLDIDSFDGTNDVESHRFYTAKKAHRCSACGSTIRTGDFYSRVYIVFEGTSTTIKRCLRCERIYEAVACALGPEEVPDEQLRCGHTWEEQFGEPPPPEIARLAFLTPREAQAELRDYFWAQVYGEK